MNPPPRAAADEADLIAALATGAGPAAIAILRLSGAGALAAARQFVTGLPDELQPRRLMRAMVVQGGDQPLDDVLVAVFPAPDSYTGENLVEVHCHGGPAIAAAVRDQAIAAGARLARAGEFTERAVRNGKMDLLEVEALAALLEADDPAGLAAARENQKLAPLLRALGERARASLAVARGELDHPLEIGSQRVAWRAEAATLATMLERLLQGVPLENAAREGVVVALLGPPNAGKSSLFNALIAEHRALVDREPGTTRDAQPRTLFLGGCRFTIVDTAGIREADGLEGRAISRSLEVAREADVVIWVEDVSVSPREPPVEVDLRVLAKDDLVPNAERAALDGGERVLRVSMVNGNGIGDLRDWIQARAPRASTHLTGRQYRLIDEAVSALNRMPEATDDLAAEYLERAEHALASLSGKTSGLVEASEIYTRLCVGK